MKLYCLSKKGKRSPCLDAARSTLTAAEPVPAVRQAEAVVHQAFEAIGQAIKPGISAGAVDAIGEVAARADTYEVQLAVCGIT